MTDDLGLPWKVGYRDGSGSGSNSCGFDDADDGVSITNAKDSAVVMSGDSFGLVYGIKDRAVAGFIVKACNSHDLLIAALWEIHGLCGACEAGNELARAIRQITMGAFSTPALADLPGEK